MNKFGYLLATTALAGLAGLPSTADAASSKFSARVAEGTLIPNATVAGGTILEIDIKTANKSDLLLGVSLETVIFTDTTVQSKGGKKATSISEGDLKVRVKVDGSNVNPNVEPDQVTFDKRRQTLSATLQGIIEECEDTLTCDTGATTAGDCTAGSDGKITIAVECTLSEEEIQLILDTMAAHHFNFVAENLSSGWHTITVEVTGTTFTSATDGAASALIGIGSGSLTVEEVRAVNDGSGIDFSAP